MPSLASETTVGERDLTTFLVGLRVDLAERKTVLAELLHGVDVCERYELG